MTTIALLPPTGPHAGARGPAFGLVISLLVHAAALAWLMHALAPRPAAEAPVARLQVRLAPPRPAPPLAPAAPATPAPAQPAAAPEAPRHRRQARAPGRAPAPARPREAPPVLNAPRAATDDLPAMPAPSTPAPGADAGPVVDLAAARSAARQIAREDARNLVALPRRKPVVDPNSGRPEPVDPIERARKSDCKTAYAGAGILAVIPLVASAVVDMGCKW